MIVSDVCDHLPEKVLSYLVPMVIGTLRPLYRLLNPYLGLQSCSASVLFPRSLRCVLELNIMSTLYSISPQASQHVVLPSLLHESSKDKKWSLTPQLFFLLELGRPPQKRRAFHEQGGCADTNKQHEWTSHQTWRTARHHQNLNMTTTHCMKWSHTYNNSQQKRFTKGSNLQINQTTKNASNPGGFSQMAFSTEVVVPAMPTDFVPFRRRKSLGDAESSWAPKWRRVALRPPDSALVFGRKKWRWVWWWVWWVTCGFTGVLWYIHVIDDMIPT